MSFRVGIGIVTYNRRNIVAGTIDRVRELTGDPDAVMVVADDGSSDGTLEMLREKRVPVITGVNKGIAWNKNRALFLLSQMLRCETVILLEDDTQPVVAGWEQEWAIAAERWGHVNFVRDFMYDRPVSGSGSAADPFCCRDVTAQCAAYSSAALTFAGYYDPLFRGFGHEHVEHSRRLVRCGYGGTQAWTDGRETVLFYLIKGGLTEVACESHANAADEARNLLLAQQLMTKPGYRAPWGNDTELRQFRSETESALGGGNESFRIKRADGHCARYGAPRRGLFGRLLHRS
jgi:hypothetical protein